MDEFRKRGYIVASTERRKRFPKRGASPCRSCGSVEQIDIAADLWNVFDLIALRPTGDDSGPARVLIQTTSAANHAARRNKIIASSEAKLCLLSGMSICVQSWRKVSNRYEYRDEWITVDQFVYGLPDTVTQYYVDEQRRKLLERKEKLPALPPGSPMKFDPECCKNLPF